MVTRKSTPKATITDTPFVETMRPEAASPEQEAKAFTAYFESLIAGLPSWKRVVVGLILSSAVAYGVGSLLGSLVAYAIVGAIMFAVPTFLVWAIYVLGMLAAIYASYRAGAFAYMSVIDKTVDAQFAKAKGWVTGLFSSAPKGATA